MGECEELFCLVCHARSHVVMTLHPKNVAEFLVKFFGAMALAAAGEKPFGAR